MGKILHALCSVDANEFENGSSHVGIEPGISRYLVCCAALRTAGRVCSDSCSAVDALRLLCVLAFSSHLLSRKGSLNDQSNVK